MDISYSYFAKLTNFTFKLYLFIIVFFTVWFWFIRSVYGWDLVISEFFYDQNDVWIEVSNAWLYSFSGNINIVWLWPIVANNIFLDTGQTIVIWNNFVDISTPNIANLLSWAWFVVDGSWFSLSLITDWVESDLIQFDPTILSHIYLSWVSYQKILDGSWVWVDWFATVRQNMTDIDTIANPWVLIQTWEIATWNQSNDADPLSYGDIQFIEIFPSSGNCMNEFIKIHSNIYYSWLVSFYGIWQSSNTTDYYLNLTPWQELLITDDISWLTPSPYILLWPTITLTNWWEQLKITASGVLLDDIIYSNLQWIQSLFYTSNSWNTRLFQTNWPWTPPNKCSQVNFTGWVWSCDIDLNSNYLWTGIYSINLNIVWQYSNTCSSWSIWVINWVTWVTDSCTTNFQNLLGSNKIEFLQYSGTDLICKDVYIFTSNYDIWYVNQYYCPMFIDTWSNSPQNTIVNQCTNSSTTSNQVMTDCHVKYQWSTLWFFANYEFNIIANIGWTDIQNNTTKYDCYRDMWDGNALTTCNPLWYEYINPWVYTINLTITEKSSSRYCKTSSFVNYPLNTNIDENHPNYLDLNDYVAEFCSNYEDLNIDDMSIVSSFCSGFYNSGFLQINSDEQYHYTWFNYISIYSVLPNPVWSDSLYEEVVLQNLSWNKTPLDGLILNIWSKVINLSWTIEWSWFKSVIWWLGLINNGMCVYLKKNTILLDQLCYKSVKEWQIVTKNGQSMTLEDSLLSLEDKQLSWSDLDIDIDKIWQKFLDLLSLDTIIGFIWDDITTDKEFSSLITSTKLIQDNYTVCDQGNWPKYCKISNPAKYSTKKPASIISRTKIDAIVYKHKYLLYKNFNDYLFNQISTWRPFVTEDPAILWYYEDLETLDNKIWSWYIYKSKDNRSYHYLNNFKQIETDKDTQSLLEITYPWLADYIEKIKTYYINKELINNIKTLQ